MNKPMTNDLMRLKLVEAIQEKITHIRGNERRCLVCRQGLTGKVEHKKVLSGQTVDGTKIYKIVPEFKDDGTKHGRHCEIGMSIRWQEVQKHG